MLAAPWPSFAEQTDVQALGLYTTRSVGQTIDV